MFDKLVAHKLAGRQKAIHAFPVCPEPFMDVSLRYERYPRAQAGITLLLDRVPELAALAGLTGLPAQNQIVAGAQDLEIVQVIQDRNSLLLQLPQDGRRQMMIDISHMSYVR